MSKKHSQLAARVDAFADDDFTELERAVAARRCFTGMNPANLQSYLNRFVYLFKVNQARGK